MAERSAAKDEEEECMLGEMKCAGVCLVDVVVVVVLSLPSNSRRHSALLYLYR